MLTGDSLFNGKLVIYQQERGYRFSVDAVLLAGLTRVRPDDQIADLGTGCGVVPLILAYRNLGKRIVGLEIQTELVELAKRNVQVNGFGERILIHEEDFRRIPSAFRPGSFTLVLSNPPYRRLCSGRVNPQGQQAVARHELKSSVADVFKAASALLAHGGRLAIIYPAARLPYLLTTARDFHLTPKELTIIHSRAGSEGRLVHLECRKGAGEELRITPPFVIYEEGRRYSEAMRLLYEGRQERETEVV